MYRSNVFYVYRLNLLTKIKEKGWVEYAKMTRFLRLFNVLVGLYLSKPRFKSQLNSYRLIDFSW